MGTRWRHPRRLPAVVLASALAVSAAVAGCDAQDDPTPPGSTDGPTKARTVDLTLAVWGNDAEVGSYERMAQEYNREASAVEVTVESWPSSEQLVQDLQSGKADPDLFMVERRGLRSVLDDELNLPLLDLLDARGVDYGDGYSREAVLAFTADDDLQCMPYDSSPMVVYYNTDLVDFADMRDRGLVAPPEDDETAWTLEAFRAAAEYASRPRTGVRGLYIDPTLRGLAPFVYSGGGEIFDDATDPTSLALSDDDSREALTEALEVLRDPQLTLTDDQLSRASAQQWFERGKLGMIAGFRDLTPELRGVQGLEFDVISMPVIDDPATVGDVSGMCISSGTEHVPQSADFLVHAIDDEAVGQVTRAGYLVPSNLEVALSDDFLQPGREPEHAGVFNSSLRYLELSPLIDGWDRLERAIRRPLRELLTSTSPDIDLLTEEIDELSRPVLDPDYDPSESPSDGSGESPSDGSSGTPSDGSS